MRLVPKDSFTPSPTLRNRRVSCQWVWVVSVYFVHDAFDLFKNGRCSVGTTLAEVFANPVAATVNQQPMLPLRLSHGISVSRVQVSASGFWFT